MYIHPKPVVSTFSRTICVRRFQVTLLCLAFVVTTVNATESPQPVDLVAPVKPKQQLILPEVLLSPSETLGSSNQISHEHLWHYQSMPKTSVHMPELTSWLEANQRVDALGGWMFYASEGSESTGTVQDPHQHHHPSDTKSHHPAQVKEQP